MILTVNGNRVLFKELEEQQESEFEQAFMAEIKRRQKQAAKTANVAQFQRESLVTLARKFELSAELLSLESGCQTTRELLGEYINELKHAIESKLEVGSTYPN